MKRAAARGVDNRNLARVMRAVRDFCLAADAPISAFIAETARDPYRVLTGCMLSLRTQDRVTAAPDLQPMGIRQNPRTQRHRARVA